MVQVDEIIFVEDNNPFILSCILIIDDDLAHKEPGHH